MSNSLSPEAEKILAVGYADNDNPFRLNLRSKLTVLTYIRIADEISQQLPPNSSVRLLDWGMGAGQMSYLLTKRGYDVVGYSYLEAKDANEVSKNEVHHTDYQFAELTIPTVSNTDPIKLPFPDAHFDAVLSCGVLEHVENETASLDEIHRILKPNGIFFIYQLPQKGSWLEFVIGRLKLGYVHERKYSVKSIGELLATHGFGIRTIRRANMLPKNFTGMPGRLKQGFEQQPKLVLKIDHTIARIPLLNQLGGILELTAYKM